jgi:hypothetical protein
LISDSRASNVRRSRNPQRINKGEPADGVETVGQFLWVLAAAYS